MTRVAGNSRNTKVAVALVAGIGAIVALWFFAQPGRSSSESGAESSPAEARAAAAGESGDLTRAGRAARADSPLTPAGSALPPSVAATSLPPVDVTVSGQVSNEDDGAPVASVDVIFSKDRAEWTATSDSAGAYSLVLGSGTYRVRALGDRVVAINLPALTVAREAKVYDVTVVHQVLIRGRVVYLDGRAAPGAIVVPQTEVKSAARLAARGELGSAEAASDGSFELLTVKGNLLLHASNDEASGTLPVMNLAAGEERSGVKIAIAPNGFLAGIVRGPDRKPVAGATVLASVQLPGSNEYDRVPLTTDAGGRFRWQVPRSGHTIVEAAASGFAQSVPQDFTLEPGTSREDLELILQPATRSLAGRVVDAKGDALADVEIAQGREGSKARYKKVFTDAEGKFEITELGPGPHRLRARKLGYEQTRVRQIRAPAIDIIVVMPLDQDGDSAF